LQLAGGLIFYKKFKIMKNHTITIQILATILLFVAASSCYFDQHLPIEPDLTPVGEMSFKDDIIPIFNASCNMAGCHNGAVAPDLRAQNAFNALQNGGYIDVLNPQGSELMQWMLGNRNLPMPLSGPNSTYNSKVLGWIEQGAKNN